MKLARGVLAVALIASTVTGMSATQATADTSRSSQISAMPTTSYWGRHYDSRYERTRKCIVYRESRGNYRVVNRRSGAAGAYQFMPRTSNAVAKMMGRRDLVGVPANRWSRGSQDQAFWTLWNHGRGRSHWAGGNMRCF